jgi:hypothetical protein
MERAGCPARARQGISWARVPVVLCTQRVECVAIDTLGSLAECLGKYTGRPRSLLGNNFTLDLCVSCGVSMFMHFVIYGSRCLAKTFQLDLSAQPFVCRALDAHLRLCVRSVCFTHQRDILKSPTNALQPNPCPDSSNTMTNAVNHLCHTPAPLYKFTSKWLLCVNSTIRNATCCVSYLYIGCIPVRLPRSQKCPSTFPQAAKTFSVLAMQW